MNDEVLKLNIQQEGINVCGYSYDVMINDRTSYCKAYFTGKYDKRNDIYVLTGIKFIENSGDHVLMTIKLWFPSRNGSKNELQGSVSMASSLLSTLLGEQDFFTVRKMAEEPAKPGKFLPVCYVKNPPIPDKVTEIPSKTETNPVRIEVKPTKPTTPPTKDSTKTKIPDKPTEPKITVEPSIPNPPDKELTREMNSRKNNAVSTIKVNTDKIQIKLYDNGTIDNDSVSVFYNGRLLKKHERLSEAPIVIDLKLDLGVKEHQLVMFAENLGSFPPNTALIIVTAGKKRYELHSSASLNENAVLNFEYQPD